MPSLGTVEGARPEGDEVHVWVADLDLSDEALGPVARTLSDDEQGRSEAFRFERHRRLFVARRAWLRAVLGTYLDLAPERVRFEYGPHGKPALSKHCDPGDLRFSLARANAVAALALTEGRALGLDLEEVHPLNDAELVATHFFSPAERQDLGRIPPPQRMEAFFNCWTRKEAYLKALGEGLACPLDSFDVSLLPGEPPRLARVGTGLPDGQRWHLRHLTPRPGYVGAVAVLGHAVSLLTRTWPARQG